MCKSYPEYKHTVDKPKPLERQKPPAPHAEDLRILNGFMNGNI